MKLSKEYIKNMKIMRIFSTIMPIIGIISIGIFLSFLRHYLKYLLNIETLAKHNLLFYFLGLISFIICISFFLYEYRVAKKKTEYKKPYILDLNENISYETLIETLKKENCLYKAELDNSSMYIVSPNKGDHFKYYFFKMDKYSKVGFKKNFDEVNDIYKKEFKKKDMNRSYKKKIRLIFIFVDNWNKVTDNLVNRYQYDLKKMESSMTYIVYKKQMYLSPIFCDFKTDRAYRFINKETKRILDKVK